MSDTDCLGCPKDNKRKAEYRWYPGSVGSYPYCETCLREMLPQSVEGLNMTKQNAYVKHGRESLPCGFAKPIGSDAPKIATEDDLESYLNGDLE